MRGELRDIELGVSHGIEELQYHLEQGCGFWDKMVGGVEGLGARYSMTTFMGGEVACSKANDEVQWRG